MKDFGFGNAGTYFGDPTDRLNRDINIGFKQGMIGLTIDEFTENYGAPAPHYIKMDVDGNEDKIIMGAERTLSQPTVRSVLIEVDRDDQQYQDFVTDKLSQAGLSLADPIIEDIPDRKVVNLIFQR